MPKATAYSIVLTDRELDALDRAVLHYTESIRATRRKFVLFRLHVDSGGVVESDKDVLKAELEALERVRSASIRRSAKGKK